MFSLHELRFVICSRDLDVLRAQRIIGFFLYLNTHKSTRSEKPVTCSQKHGNDSGTTFHNHAQ